MNLYLKLPGWVLPMGCLLGILLTISGCQTPRSSGPQGRENTPLTPQSGGSVDLLRAGDILVITFSGVQDSPPRHEDRVSEDGLITLPFIGEVKAAGKTRAQLQQEIIRQYVPRYFLRLNVNVNSDARYFYVYGEVKRPSYYTYPGTMTILKAIATAGDFTDFAKRTKIELIRSNGQRPIVVNCVKAQQDPKLDLPIFPDDKIFVPRRLW